MISRSTIKSLASSEDWMNLFNSCGYSGYYVEGTDLFVRIHGRDRNQVEIGDVGNAYKRGKECVFYTLRGNEYDSIYKFLGKLNYDILAIYNACDALDFDTEDYGSFIEKLTVSRRVKKGVNTYSPFLLNRLNPLKDIPKKWRLSHTIRMLANDQFEGLCTRAKYTDDYAMDAAYDFQKGAICHMDMLRELVEEPRGWWINGPKNDGEKLGINCHQFDYKDCIVRLLCVPVKESKEQSAVVTDTLEAKEKDISTQAPPSNSEVKPAGILMH